jgi:hypothetical protein
MKSGALTRHDPSRRVVRRWAGHRIGRIAHMRRYREIVSVLVKYGFVDVVQALHLSPYLAAGRLRVGH